jgi:guanylate kinase
MMNEASNGKVVIFSAPSGAGKTTIVRYLLAKLTDLKFSVSACSREPRMNEIHGRDYYFLGVEGFKKHIQQKELLEWQEVYKDNFYGTLKSEVEKIWNEGKTVIFDVDVIGGINLKKAFGNSALSIFVNPPSVDSLEVRLRHRSTESEDKIQMRLAKAKQELSYRRDFDMLLLNDDLETACHIAEKMVLEFLET